MVEIAVSIPAGRALGLSKVTELAEGDASAVTNVLREHRDSGLPWWRIVTDEGSPVFGGESGGRALERYLIESTPIVPSSSEFGFAVNLAAAAPDAVAVSEIATVMAEPAAASAPALTSDDADDAIENAPAWAGTPVSARTAVAVGEAETATAVAEDEPAAIEDPATDLAGEGAADDAANADASEDAPAAPASFSFDALLRGESGGSDNGSQNRTF